MAEGLIPTLAKDDSPHLDSSFSFHTEDSSPLETPKIGFPSKISVFSGEASPIRVVSPSALSRKPGKTSTFITPLESPSTLFASTRHGSIIKINGEPFSPERKLSRMMTRRSTFLDPGTPRKSKVFKVLPICSIGEQDMAAEDQEAEAKKNKPARERTRDLNSMSTDELLDLAVKILKKESEKRNIRELQALSKCVAQVGFFKDCDKDTTMKCLRHMSYERFRTNQTVFEINTMGTTFWVILRGSVGVWVNVKKVVGVNEDGEDIVEEVLTEVKTLPAGSSFGELALLESKKKRAASIVCKEDCEFAVLEKSHFVAILKEKETRKLYNEVDFLVSLPLFQSWSYNGVKYLYYNTTVQKYKRGHVFYDEGDAPQKMYIVRSGELKLLKLANGKDDKSKDPLEKFKGPIFKKIVEMGIIGEKAIVGEEELLLGCKRKYKLVCHSLEAEVCEISKSVFLEKMLKFPHTKEWLNNYVKTREEYYQSRLKTIHQNTPLAMATPRLSFSQKEVKDTPSRMKSPSKPDIVTEISPPIEPIPSAFLRATPKKPGKRNSPDCRLTHTESDSQRNESQLAMPKLVIPFGNLAFSEVHNAEKEQQNNERILMEQLDMKFYDTPSRRQLQLSRNASKGSRGSRERRSPKDTPHSPEDGTVISFRDEVERLKKRVSNPHANSARKDTEKEKSTFYISKMEQTLTLKTEESIGTLTNIHGNRDAKPIGEQLAHDYGLEKSLSHSNVSPIGRRPMTTTSSKRPFTGQTGRSSAKDSAVLYNRTFTDMGDTSQSSRLTLTDFKPSIENVSLKRLGQIESMKQKLLASMKPKKPPKLYVQGFSASSFENVGFSQTARSSTSRTKKLFLASKKEAVRNVSTSIEKRPNTNQGIKVWDLLQTERSKNETTTTMITKQKIIPDLMKKANIKRKNEITVKSDNGKVFLL